MRTFFKALVFLLLGAIAFLTAVWFILGGPELRTRRNHFNSLVKTGDHQAILDAAIPIITATTNDVIFSKIHGGQYPSISSLPSVISKMEPNYVSVDPHKMTIEFHGGFDHYGFEIRNTDSKWLMTWYTEKGHRDILSFTNQSEQFAPRKD